MPQREKDANTTAAELLADVTGTKKPRGQRDLPMSRALERELARLKAADRKRRKS